MRSIITLPWKRSICMSFTKKTLNCLAKWASKHIGYPLPGHAFFSKVMKTPNEEGLHFYEDVFRECHKYGIEPLVTITHFDCPIHLIKEYGGWRNRKVIHFYERFVLTLFTRYKGMVKYWLTFNEINMILHLPFMRAGLVFDEGEKSAGNYILCSASYWWLLQQLRRLRMRLIQRTRLAACWLQDRRIIYLQS